MPRFKTHKRVKHSADDMFGLVADVEAYPNFVPLCQKLVVRARRVQDDGTSLVIADMTVAYKAIKETFSSRVTLDPQARVIVAEYLDGPFRHMRNRWTFVPDGQGACVVEFDIDYEFKSRALSLLMGAMFDRAFRKFTTAFEARADAIYGVA